MSNQLALIATAELPAVPVADVADLWLESLTDRTRETYSESWGIYLSWANQGSIAEGLGFLCRIGRGRCRMQLVAFQSAQRAQGLKPATINLRISAIRSALNFCRKSDIIDWQCEIDGLKNDAAPVLGPDLEKVRELIKLAGQHPNQVKATRDQCLMTVMFVTAIRRKEILGCRLSSYANGRLSILGKGRSCEQDITLPEPAIITLDAWLAVRPACDTDALFTRIDTRNPGELSASGFYAIVRRLGKDAGIPNLSPHKIRHSSTVAAIKADQPLVSIVEFLRHSNPSLVMRYAATIEDRAGGVASAVGDLL